MMEEEQVTTPCCTLESYANTIWPRNGASTAMITARHAIVIRPRYETCTTTAEPTPVIV